MSVKSVIISGAKSVKDWGCKNSPTLLTIGAVITAVGAVGTAIYATTKVNDIFQDANKEIADIHAKMNDDNLIQNGRYSLKDGRKDLFKVYLKTGGKLLKLYLPTALLLSTSVASTLGARKILSDRNAAAMAAYELISNSYDAYRGRVRNEIGEDKEQELYEAKDSYPSAVQVVNEKTGDVEHKVVPNADRKEFEVLWDEYVGSAYSRSASLNLEYLMAKESWLTTKLHTVGHITWREALEDIGYNVVRHFGPELAQKFNDWGWVYSDDPNDPAYNTVVSFGIDTYDPATGVRNLNESGIRMLRGESNVWLKPNIFGYIHDGMFAWSKYDRGVLLN